MAAVRIAIISAWAVGSRSCSVRLPTAARMAPSAPTTTAPIGTSPRSAAARASRSARSMGDALVGPVITGKIAPTRGQEECHALQLHAGAGRISHQSATGSGGPLADQGGAPPDGDRGRLRARRLAEAEPGAGAHGYPHPRGLWRR